MSINRRFFLRCVLGLLLSSGLMAALPGTGQAQSAASFVQSLGNDAITTMARGNLGPDGISERFRQVLRSNFDTAAIGQFVLGRYWAQATPAQQQEYLSLFEKMIVKTYADRFRQYSGETFQVTSSRVDASGDTMVQSQVVRPNGPPVNVEWRVRGGSRIVDVVVEGVSMSVTQRSEFASVIQSNGGQVEGLLRSLRQRVGG